MFLSWDQNLAQLCIRAAWYIDIVYTFWKRKLMIVEMVEEWHLFWFSDCSNWPEYFMCLYWNKGACCAAKHGSPTKAQRFCPHAQPCRQNVCSALAAQLYGIPAGMYACQIKGSPFLQGGTECTSQLQITKLSAMLLKAWSLSDTQRRLIKACTPRVWTWAVL